MKQKMQEASQVTFPSVRPRRVASIQSKTDEPSKVPAVLLKIIAGWHLRSVTSAEQTPIVNCDTSQEEEKREGKMEI
jgi:hypothetical protein